MSLETRGLRKTQNASMEMNIQQNYNYSLLFYGRGKVGKPQKHKLTRENQENICRNCRGLGEFEEIQGRLGTQFRRAA